MKVILLTILCLVFVNNTIFAATIIAPYRTSASSGKFILLNNDATEALIAGSDAACIMDIRTGTVICSLPDDGSDIKQAVFTNNGKRFATLNNRNEIRIWETKTGNLLSLCLAYNNKMATHIQFNRLGDKMICSYADGSCVVWDIEESKIIDTVYNEGESVIKPMFNKPSDYIITVGKNKRIQCRNIDTGESIQIDQTSKSSAKLFYNNNDDKIALAEGYVVRIFDPKKGELIGTYNALGGGVNSVAFDNKSERIITTHTGGETKIWSIKTKSILAEFHSSDSRTNYAEFNNTGDKIVVGGNDKKARVWSWTTNTQITYYAGHLNNVQYARFAKGGDSIVSIGDNYELRLWSSENSKELIALEGHSAPIIRAVLNKNSSHILTISDDSTAKLWDAQSGRTIKNIRSADMKKLSAAEFNTEGNCFVLVGGNRAYVYNTETASIKTYISNTDGIIKSVGYNAAGNRIVTACGKKVIRVWDAEKGVQIMTLSGHSGEVMDALFNKNDNRIVSYGNDGEIIFWDAQSGIPLHKGNVNDGQIKRMELSATGNECVTFSRTKTKIWDINTGEIIATFSGYKGTISPNGKYAVTITDNTATIWQISTGIALHILQGHLKDIESVVFNTEGSMIVTASADNTARIWEIATGKNTEILSRHNGKITIAQFDNSRKKVLTAGDDATIKMWNLEHILASAKAAGYEINKALCTLMPNPAYSDIKISFTETLLQSAWYNIYNNAGQPVQSGVISENTDIYTLPVYELPSGIYMLLINTNGIVKQEKFTVLR